jgi:hypothetical protein
MDGFRGIDLPGGRRQLAAPLATHRSWVNVRGRSAAIELTASFERALGAPMSDLLEPVTRDSGFVHVRIVKRLRSPPALCTMFAPSC